MSFFSDIAYQTSSGSVGDATSTKGREVMKRRSPFANTRAFTASSVSIATVAQHSGPVSWIYFIKTHRHIQIMENIIQFLIKIKINYYPSSFSVVIFLCIKYPLLKQIDL